MDETHSPRAEKMQKTFDRTFAAVQTRTQAGHRVTVWLGFGGQRGSAATGDAVGPNRTKTTDFAAGIESELAAGYRIGGALSYSEGSTEIGSSNSSAKQKNLSAMFYGAREFGNRVTVSLGAGYGSFLADTRRATTN